jgi:hypothetical protein
MLGRPRYHRIDGAKHVFWVQLFSQFAGEDEVSLQVFLVERQQLRRWWD